VLIFPDLMAMFMGLRLPRHADDSVGVNLLCWADFAARTALDANACWLMG
jgi:hypothetical protein